ncbi:TauD/TfdA family dioxygenase [Rhodococcus sp. CX]|uniref:TauD/TfdA dioxygenase family protein n=2 Tax=unclassified Rhodococcus (in: high G+C Gram-positive bacteria) TaxID=192944 RepID=UPI0018CF9B18|nr:TauD/TfdA family dioxygenase [Rhodococcus sp. CX]MBH0120640.1 TauD/TfdA family dioxygenase [Rhodococcus sp. CX]
MVGAQGYPRLHFGTRELRRTAGEQLFDQSYERLTLRPVGVTIGALVEGVDLGEIDAETHLELHRALLEWKVLFFRDQHLTGAEHIALANLWGDIEANDFFPNGEAQEISRLAKDDTAVGMENIWHSDTSFRSDPSMLSILRAIEVPEIGGETMWADMAAAYDNLPDEVRERIDDLTATHTFVKSWGLTMTDKAIAEMERIHPRISHPVVRTHPETGRKFLYVNEPFTEVLDGLPGDEADALLDYLLFQARVPEYQVRFRWEPGSVAIWDNRITQHYAVSDYFPQRRVMERVTVVGDQPF